MFVVEHIKIAPYQPRSNGQAEQFVNTFKRALKIQQWVHWGIIATVIKLYRLTSNKNVPSIMIPTGIMFALKIRSVFEQLIPNKKTFKHTVQKTIKNYKFHEVGEKVFYRMYLREKYWEIGTIVKRIGRMIYLKDRKWCTKGTWIKQKINTQIKWTILQ